MENEQQQQKQSAVARERFLRLLVSAENSECELHMYEKTKVSGVYQCADVMFQKFAVKSLLTPIAVYEDAYVRTSDVLCTTLKINV